MNILKKLAQEPLLQFLLLGAIVIGVNHYVLGNAEDPRRIVFDDARYREIAGIFEEGQGRKPLEPEMQNLIVKWTQNEVMYREARLMGLDQGDDMIRERLILKIRNILFNNLVTQLPPVEQLRAWFEQNRVAYDRPALYDFEQFLVEGADAGSAAALAAKLGSEPHPKEYEETYRLYAKRPEGNVVTAFSANDARRLIDAPDDRWLAVQSDYGWHLARVLERQPSQPTDFEDVRSAVAQDWLKVMQQKDLNDALAAILEDYDIRYEVTKDAVDGTLATAGPPAAAAVR